MSNPSTPSIGPSTAASPAAATVTTPTTAQAVPVVPRPPSPPRAPQTVENHPQPPLAQAQAQAQAQVPQTRVLGPLQPLPRGRPPRANGVANTGTWQTMSTTVSQPALNDMPASQPQQQPPQLQQLRKQTPLEPAYTRGGHLIGGFNPARYPGVSFAHPKFTPEGKLLILTGATSLNPWAQQITYVARNLSCLQELTKRFVAYPKPSTVQLFICETRFATAWRVLEGSISGPVWAYMRVLGYSAVKDADDGLMSPQPADCFDFAKRAAAQMLIPGTPEQPLEERRRMVDEVLMAQSTDYPSERAYKKGINWLRLACDSLIRQGDFELATCLYEPIPDWAPRPPGYIDPTTPEVPAAESDPSSPRGRSESQRPPDASATEDSSTSAGEVAGESTNESAGSATTGCPTPPPPRLAADKPSAKKRKRSRQDEGSGAAKDKV